MQTATLRSRSLFWCDFHYSRLVKQEDEKTMDEAKGAEEREQGLGREVCLPSLPLSPPPPPT